MRIFTAALATETNTFSPILIAGELRGDRSTPRPGSIRTTPTLCTAPISGRRGGAPGGGLDADRGDRASGPSRGARTAKATYEALRDEILGQLEAALPVDAVMLGLHGAMVADGYDDCEGDLLERVRAMVGPEVPICVELDPHSHLTAKRVARADFIIVLQGVPAHRLRRARGGIGRHRRPRR